MRTLDQRRAVARLIAEGHSNRAVSRQTGIPVGTVREWRIAGAAEDLVPNCARCGGAHSAPEHLDRAAYAYLLGQYLGDGCISDYPRDVYRLRISCCAAYPGVLSETRAAVEAVAPRGRSGTVTGAGVIEVYSDSKTWPCLLPQHGPGRKHTRPIALTVWQREIVDEHAGLLVRGLIHSDGWRGTNRVVVRGKAYEYPRYNFSNRSEDIKRIFCDALDRLCVSWRRMNATDISIARRADVARLDEFVGPKS